MKPGFETSLAIRRNSPIFRASMAKKKKSKEELLVKLFVQRVSSATTFAKRFKRVCRLLDSSTKLTDEQWIQVWRGLYYCVWYTEMGKGGEELIARIGANDNRQMLLTGFQALTNDWFGIDAFRLDKYMLLARVMVNTCLQLQTKDLINKTDDKSDSINETKPVDQYISENLDEEEDNEVESSDEAKTKKKSLPKNHRNKLNKISNKQQNKEIEFPIKFRSEIIDKILSTIKTSIGLTLHITDIFVDEMVKVFNGFKLKSKEKIDLYFDTLLPFVKLMAVTEDHRVLTNIRQNIFDKSKKQILIGESIEARKVILQKFIDAMIDIGGVAEIGRKNRDSIYSTAESFKTKLSQLNDTKDEKTLKRKKILIGKGRHKKVKYEVTSRSPFVTSIVPIPVV